MRTIDIQAFHSNLIGFTKHTELKTEELEMDICETLGNLQGQGSDNALAVAKVAADAFAKAREHKTKNEQHYNGLLKSISAWLGILQFNWVK